MAAIAGPRWSSGVAGCHADPRTAGPCPRRAIRRGAALLRSNRAARAGAQHRPWSGPTSPSTTEHVDVALSSSVNSVTQELPRGHASAARLLSVSESGVVGLGRRVSDGLLVTQSFGRHLRAVLGVTAGEFRRRFPFDVALARYIDLLITPYREALRAFHPFNAGSWDQGPNATAVFRAG